MPTDTPERECFVEYTPFQLLDALKELKNEETLLFEDKDTMLWFAKVPHLNISGFGDTKNEALVSLARMYLGLRTA